MNSVDEEEIVRKDVYLKKRILPQKTAFTFSQPKSNQSSLLYRCSNSFQTPKRIKPTVLPRFESTPIVKKRKFDSKQNVGSLIEDITPIKRLSCTGVSTCSSMRSSKVEGMLLLNSKQDGLQTNKGLCIRSSSLENKIKSPIQNRMLTLDESVFGSFDLESLENNYWNNRENRGPPPVSQKLEFEKRCSSPDIFSGGNGNGNQVETVTSNNVVEEAPNVVAPIEYTKSGRVAQSQKLKLECGAGGAMDGLDQHWADLRAIDVDWINDSMVATVMKEVSLPNGYATPTCAVPVRERIRRALITNAHKPVTKKLPTEKFIETKKHSPTSKETSACFDIGPFFGLPSKVKLLIQQLKGINHLYKWQEECLNLRAIGERKNLVFALPTSGGKTLVAEILILKELLCCKKNAILVLPYVSIVQEKVRSMSPFAVALDFLVEEYAAAKGQYPPKKRRWKQSVYIATIEKALGLVNSLLECERLGEIGLVVVDELHLLGEGGGRGSTLEGFLVKLLYSSQNIHIVGMSATIGNLNELALFLQAETYTEDFRPVELKEYIKCEDSIWAVNSNANCQEDLLTLVRTLSCPYTPKLTKLDPDRLGMLVQEVIPQDSCLVFCPSKKNCENVAQLICQVLPRTLMEHKKEEKKALLRALSSEGSGSVCSILKRTLPFGIVYHHSGLTMDERRLLEEAFMSGTVCCICCTSTLAAGVNLPAKRVILRAPYIGTDFINLSRYKQMVGRAGRTGMGNIGESILICKSSETQRVGNLLRSTMDDVCSSLHSLEGRGLRTLVLSVVGLGLATTREEIQAFAQQTLLAVQCVHLGVNVKHLTDQVITDLFKKGALRVTCPGTTSDTSIIDNDISIKMSASIMSPKKTPNKPFPSQRSSDIPSPKNILEMNGLLGSSQSHLPTKLPSPLIVSKRKNLKKTSPVRRPIGDLVPVNNNKRNSMTKSFSGANKGKKTLLLHNTTRLGISRLGKAAIKGPMELSRAHQLYKDLVQAQASLVLLSCLHLLYLVTPYELVGQIKPVPNVYFLVYNELNIKDLQTARILGISEACVLRIMNGQSVRLVSEQVVQRFYLTLMLNELWNQKSVWHVADKYQVPRGAVQSLMTSAAAFAACVTRFCEELEEFWAFKDLLVGFSQRLSHCCSSELLPLMELPAVKRGRAKQLFNAGFKTLKDIANAEPQSLVRALDHMPRKTAHQIVAAAKLLLLEKIETLREEAEDVLEGLYKFHDIPSAEVLEKS